MDLHLLFRILAYTAGAVFCARDRNWLGWVLCFYLIISNAFIALSPLGLQLWRDIGTVLIVTYLIARR